MSKKLQTIKNIIWIDCGLLFLTLVLAIIEVLFAEKNTPVQQYTMTILLLLAALFFLSVLFILVLPAYKRLLYVMDKLTDGDEQKLLKCFGADVKSGAGDMAEEIRSDIIAEQNLHYQAEIEKKQIILSALQRQINPHFLYNTLDCIRGEALLRDQEEIADIICVLSSFFRYSISRKSNIVTVYEEIQNVQNYFKIQRFRFSDLAPLEIVCEGDSATIYDTLIPKLTLQPLVENAIGHGVSAVPGIGQITLIFTQMGQDLVVRCKDNGIGIPLDKLKQLNDFINTNPEEVWDAPLSKGTGIGMRNVNRRISLFFGKPYGLTIYSVFGEGTTVEIRIPSTFSASGGAPHD